MACCIYLVGDDDRSNLLLLHSLEQEGWAVTVFSGETEPLLPITKQPALWIVDADDETGFEIMRTMRKTANNAPVILISANERMMDRTGLEFGCDDFVVKPFSVRELVLRIRRILARPQKTAQAYGNLVRMQDYLLDPNRRLAAWNNQCVDLTTKEFDLLMLFAQHKGMALSREQIIRFVWGEDYFGSDRVVDDLIRRTRRKLERLKVETLYGYGYRITS